MKALKDKIVDNKVFIACNHQVNPDYITVEFSFNGFKIHRDNIVAVGTFNHLQAVSSKVTEGKHGGYNNMLLNVAKAAYSMYTMMDRTNPYCSGFVNCDGDLNPAFKYAEDADLSNGDVAIRIIKEF